MDTKSTRRKREVMFVCLLPALFASRRVALEPHRRSLKNCHDTFFVSSLARD